MQHSNTDGMVSKPAYPFVFIGPKNDGEEFGSIPSEQIL